MDSRLILKAKRTRSNLDVRERGNPEYLEGETVAGSWWSRGAQWGEDQEPGSGRTELEMPMRHLPPLAATWR